MTASASFDHGSGWLPGAPLPGGRDHTRRAERQARRQAARQLAADTRMGLEPVWRIATPAPPVLPAGGGMGGSVRQHARRVLSVALAAALIAALAVPQLVDGVAPDVSTQPASEDVVRVLADDAGHRFDGGHVREVETDLDGTLWVAVGRRVLALGTPGAIRPRAQDWEAIPRRLSAAPDGSLWALEDEGVAVTLTDAGWVSGELPFPELPSASRLDPAAVELLRAAGFEQAPRVLAEATGLDGQRWIVVDVSQRSDQRPADYRLLRSDGVGWTVLGPEEGLPRDTRKAWTMPLAAAPVALTVDRSGRAWFSIDTHGLWTAGDDGVERVRFAGLGSGALDLAGTPDGAVWIASSRGGLFRWFPDDDVAL